jgi:hypothetical protein
MFLVAITERYNHREGLLGGGEKATRNMRRMADPTQVTTPVLASVVLARTCLAGWSAESWLPALAGFALGRDVC